MCLMIILKVKENQGFTLSLEDTFFEKPQGESNWPPPTVLGLRNRKQRVLLNGKTSSGTDVNGGVHQGPILGPLLF